MNTSAKSAVSSAPASNQQRIFQLAQDVKSKINIVDYIRQYTKVSVKPNNKGEYSAVCCFHDDSSPSMSINPQKGLFYCAGCGTSGSVIQFHEQFHNVRFYDAVKRLAKDYGIESAAFTPASSERAVDLKLLRERAEYYQRSLYSALGEQALQYVRDARGLDSETLEKFMVGFGRRGARGSHDYSRTGIYHPEKKWEFMTGRLVFPVRDVYGDVIAFGGRRLNDGSSSVKYLNTPETPYFKKSSVLYGLYESQESIAKANRAIVLEGYLDVLSAHQYGVTNTVAEMGTAFSHAHAALLWQRADEITMCLDGDAAGIKGALRAIVEVAPVMSDGKRMSVTVIPDGQDPDEYLRAHDKQAFEALIAQALPISTFLIRSQMKDFEMRTAEGRASFKAEIRKYATLFVKAPLFAQELVSQADLHSDLKALASMMREDAMDNEELLKDEILRLHEVSSTMLERFDRKRNTFS